MLPVIFPISFLAASIRFPTVSYDKDPNPLVDAFLAQVTTHDFLPIFCAINFAALTNAASVVA